LYKKLHVKIQDQLKSGKYKNPKANLKGSNWITEVSDQRKQQKKTKLDTHPKLQLQYMLK
jgi:hypothetical protein